MIWKNGTKKITILATIIFLFFTSVITPLLNFPPIAGGEEPFSQNVKVNDDTNIADQNKPSIAVDSNGTVYAVWEDRRSGDWDIYFAKSEDEGLTWTDQNIRISNDVSNKTQSAPAIAVDLEENIYVVWQDDRDGDYDIYFTKFKDGSASLTNPNIKISNGSGSQSAPAIALDSKGVIYVVWEDYRWGDYDIYFTKSEDGGETWLSENKRVNTGGAGSTQLNPTIAVDSSGAIYVAWEDWVNYDVVFSKSTDGGETWTTYIRVNDVITNSQGNPSIAVGTSGNIYLIWEDYRNSNGDIYFAKSEDKGGNWTSPNIKVNDGSTGTQQSPTIAVSSTGTIYATWHDNRNGNRDIYFSYSINEGITWVDPNLRVDDDKTLRTQGFPAIGVGQRGPVYVAWEDYRNGNDDIYCANIETIHPYPIADSLKVEGYLGETPGIMHVIQHKPTFSFIYKDPSSDPLSKYNVSVWDDGGGTILWWSNRSYSAASGSEVTVKYNTDPHPTSGPPLIDGTSYKVMVSVANITGFWGPFFGVTFHMNQVLTPITPISPIDKSLIIASTTQIVSWTSPGLDAEGDMPVTYLWEVATDSVFENIVESGSGLVLESETFDTTPSGYFYWRVKLNDGWETGLYGNQPDGYWVFTTYTPGLNSPPTITNKEDAPTNAVVNFTLTFTFEATDPDSDPLSWGKISGPSWLTIGNTNGTIYGSPSLEDLGLSTFEIQVSDGKGGTDSHIFSISVEPITDDDGDDEDQLDYEWDTIPMSVCLLIIIIIAILLLILLLRLLRRKKEKDDLKSQKEPETVDKTSEESKEKESDENMTSLTPSNLQSQEKMNQKNEK